MRHANVTENQHISLQRCLSRGWSTPEKGDETQHQCGRAKHEPSYREQFGLTCGRNILKTHVLYQGGRGVTNASDVN
jgi:hypothetical protein